MPSDRHIPEVDGPEGIGRFYAVGAAEQWDRSLVHQRSRVEQAIIQSYETSALSAADYCRQAIETAESQAERVRRSMCYQRRMILYDAWRPLLVADIKNRLAKDLWTAVIGADGDYADTSRNAARAIWEEMAVLYKQPALRATPDAPGADDEYKKLVRWSDFHPFWQSVEVQLAAFNDVIIWPTTRKRRGKKVLQHNAIAGDCCSALFDPELTDGPAVLVFFYRYNIGNIAHTRWTVHTPWWEMAFSDDRSVSRVDPVTGSVIADDDPRGDKTGDDWPFVFINRDPFHPWFWDQTSGTDLIDLTLKLGRRQTDDDYLWHRASFKQLLATGERLTTKGKTLLDPSAVITFQGSGISTTIVDWQVDFKTRQDVVNGEEIRAAASRGINPERLRRTGYQTAQGAKLSERGLIERRERFESIFARAEDEYYHLCAKLAADERMDARPDPEAELEVTYGPIDYMGDPLQQLAVDEQRARLGLQAMTDSILAEHPSWTRERALEYLAANVAELSEVARIKQMAGVPAKDLGNRSLDDERNGSQGPVARDEDADDSTGSGPPTTKPIGE